VSSCASLRGVRGFQIARFWRAFRGRLRRALYRAMADGSRYRKRRPAGRMAERARAAPVVSAGCGAYGGQAFGGATRWPGRGVSTN
jgi:hypothetical protein